MNDKIINFVNQRYIYIFAYLYLLRYALQLKLVKDNIVLIW